MGLIDLVLDFYDGYSFTDKNLDQSVQEGKLNAYSLEHYEEAESLSQNPFCALGSLAASLLHPEKTAKLIQNRVSAILVYETILFREFNQYLKSRLYRFYNSKIYK